MPSIMLADRRLADLIMARKQPPELPENPEGLMPEVDPQAFPIAVGNHVHFKVTQEVMDATSNRAPQTLNSNSPMVVAEVDEASGMVVLRRENTLLGAVPYQYLDVVPTPPEEVVEVPPEFIIS